MKYYSNHYSPLEVMDIAAKQLSDLARNNAFPKDMPGIVSPYQDIHLF